MSQPAVSHHLALLRVSHLVETRREGKHNFYSIAESPRCPEVLEGIFAAVGFPRPKGRGR